MYLKLKHITIISVIWLITLNLIAQDKCSEVLQTASGLYNEGIIEEIPGLLEPCIQDGFSKNEKIEAYKLLILAFLFDDNQFEAEKIMREFLKNFPDYNLMPNDPIEFVYFFKSFVLIPKFSIGLTVGSNLSDPVISQSYTTGNFNELSAGNQPGFGYQVGLSLTQHITKPLFLNLDVFYSVKNYRFTDEILNFTKITLKEKFESLTIPLSVIVELGKGKSIPYFRIGGGINYTLNTDVTPIRTYNQSNIREISGANIDLTEHRNELNYFIISGLGMNIKMGKGLLRLDVSYQLGLSDMVNPDTRFNIQELWSRYYYIEDDFKLNALLFNVGYNYSFFKPLKRY